MVQSPTTSLTAARSAASLTRFLPEAMAATKVCKEGVLAARGEPRGVANWGDGVLGEQMVRAVRDLQPAGNVTGTARADLTSGVGAARAVV